MNSNGGGGIGYFICIEICKLSHCETPSEADMAAVSVPPCPAAVCALGRGVRQGAHPGAAGEDRSERYSLCLTEMGRVAVMHRLLTRQDKEGPNCQTLKRTGNFYFFTSLRICGYLPLCLNVHVLL
jgi:hypothetical protein